MKDEYFLDEEFTRPESSYPTKWTNVLGIGAIYGVYSLSKFYFLAVLLAWIHTTIIDDIMNLILAFIVFILIYIFLCC
jgi:hypothetical protein